MKQKIGSSILFNKRNLAVLVICSVGVGGCGQSSPSASDEAAAAARIAPVGKVNVGEPRNAYKPEATAPNVAEATGADTQGTADADKGEAPGSVQTTQNGDGAPAEKGKSIYESACFICHDTGAAGAPKLGDKAAWAARISQGMDALVSHAINGFQGSTGMMPPKGGRTDLSDEDIRAAVAYIVGASQ